MLDLFTIKPRAAGLDISETSLKFAQLEKRGALSRLKSAANFEVPKGVIEGGEIKDAGAFTEILKHFRAERKLERCYVIASLPEDKAFLQVIQLPRMEINELQKAVYFEAENYIPLPINEVYLDFNIIAPEIDGEDHIDVLLAAMPRKTIDQYASCLKSADFKPLALEIESLAMTRAIIKNSLSSIPVVILDIGATKTVFMVFSGRSLRFTASIRISARDLTYAIGRELNYDFSKAEEVKITYGLSARRDDVMGRKIAKAMDPVLNALVEQFKKYIDYYLMHASHEHIRLEKSNIAEIRLCGGGANLKGLSGFLERELKLPVVLGNPWINIFGETVKDLPRMSYDDSRIFTTAFGLAERGLDND